MRILRPHRSRREVSKAKAELRDIADARPVTGRVCGAVCTMRCGACGSRKCACMCRPACARAPYCLSSDPEHYPIEPAILPLVFAMRRSGIFHPVWSCEGHTDSDGALWKRPAVWFCCAAPSHGRVLADSLFAMHHDGRLATRWQVSLGCSELRSLETTFALQPVFEGDAPDLAVLRSDVAVIAGAIIAQTRKCARMVLAASDS